MYVCVPINTGSVRVLVCIRERERERGREKRLTERKTKKIHTERQQVRETE